MLRKIGVISPSSEGRTIFGDLHSVFSAFSSTLCDLPCRTVVDNDIEISWIALVGLDCYRAVDLVILLYESVPRISL